MYAKNRIVAIGILRCHCTKPPNHFFAEIMRYIHPMDSGSATVRNLKQKSAVSFWFKVT